MENTERKNKKPRLHWGKVGILIDVGPILDDNTTTSTNQGAATE